MEMTGLLPPCIKPRTLVLSKELDPRPLDIRRIDLAIEGCSEDPLAQGDAVAGSQALLEWARA
jgi:hypothetical protein